MVPIALLAVQACSFDDAAPTHGLEDVHALVHIDTADGARTVTIVARLDLASAPVSQPVMFTTTAGTFGPTSSSISVMTDSLGMATAHLQAPKDSAIAYITATAVGMEGEDSVLFVPAPPTLVEIALTPPSLPVDSTRSVTITTTLARVSGTPSPGFVVHFAATDLSQVPPGSFTADSMLAAANTASVTFFARPLLRGETVLIVARAQRGALQLSDTARLLVGP